MTSLAKIDFLDIALELRALGCNPIPVDRTKRPVKNARGKRTSWAYAQGELLSASDVQNNSNWSRAEGVAVVSGVNNLVCMDFDKQHNRDSVDTALEMLGLPLDYEWLVLSGSGTGYHIYLTCPDFAGENKTVRDGFSSGQIELRHTGHYSLVPPSAHESGNSYRWANGQDMPSEKPVRRTWEVLEGAYDAITKQSEPDAPKKRDRSTEARQQRKRDLAGKLPAEPLEAIPAALLLTSNDYKSDGWSKNIACIFANHEHDNTRPGAGWNRDKHIFRCFKCNETWLAKDTAAALGIEWKTPVDTGIPAGNLTAAPADGQPDVKPKKPKRRKKWTKSKPRKKTVQEKITSFELDTFTADLTVNIPYVSELPPDVWQHPTIAIAADTGTGKSEAMKERIAQAQSVLIPVPYQALARSIASRYNIACYSDLTDSEIATADKIVICLDSLHKTSRRKQAYKLVVLDEPERLLTRLDDELLSRGAALTAFQILRKHVSQARQVIALDAGLTDAVTGDLLRTWRGEVYAIKNTYQRPRPTLTIYNHEHKTNERGLTTAKAGETFAHATDKSTSENLRDLYSEEAVDAQNLTLINSLNSTNPDEQDLLKNINNRELSQGFIYSSSVGIGIDIQPSRRAVLGSFKGNWFTAKDAKQQLERFRNVDEMHVFMFANSTTGAPEDWQTIYEDSRRAALQTALAGDFAEHGIRATSPDQDELNRLLAKVQAVRNRSTNNSLSHFVALMQASGYEIQFNNEKSPATAKLMKVIKERKAEAQKTLTLASEPIDRFQLDEMRITGEKITPEIWAGHLRYKIESCTGQIVGDESYDLFNRSRDREALRRLTDLRLPDELLYSHDRNEAQMNERFRHRSHRGQNAALGRSLIKALFDVSDVKWLKLDKEITRPDLVERMTAWLAKHQQAVDSFVGRRKAHSDDPRFVASWLLERFGLKLKSKQVMVSLGRFYVFFIDPDALRTFLAYSDSRIQAVYGGITQNLHKAVNQVLSNPQNEPGKPALQPVLEGLGPPLAASSA